MLLSLCMIACNESEVIGRCLKSVAGLVDEIVVVDSGSQDHTAEVARRFGARVFRRPWQNDFSAARNFSLEKARGEWVLVMDADEEWLGIVQDDTGRPAQNLRQCLQESAAAALEISIRNLLPEQELESFHEFRLTRIFRNRREYRYQGKIHEQIRPAIEAGGGEIAASPFTILHHGYARPVVQGNGSRLQRNLPLLIAELESRPDDAYLHYQLGISYKELGKMSEAHRHLRQAYTLGKDIAGSALWAKLLTRLSQVELALDHTEAAEEYARQALQMQPDNLIAEFVVGLTTAGRCQFQQALESFRRIQANPRASSAYRDQLETLIRFCREKTGSGA